MSKNTCASVTIYANPGDRLIEPFMTQRDEKALAMFNEGKCESFPNATLPHNGVDFLRMRYWIDHAAAQEYIDYILSLAASYNIEIYCSIADFDISDISTTVVVDMPNVDSVRINIDDNSWIETP
jgi:hypothetical protein